MLMAAGKVLRSHAWCEGQWWSKKRRCGKANCHCASGVALHETTVLNYSEGGRARAVMLPVEAVGAAAGGGGALPLSPRKPWRTKGNAGLAELVADLGRAEAAGVAGQDGFDRSRQASSRASLAWLGLARTQMP